MESSKAGVGLRILTWNVVGGIIASVLATAKPASHRMASRHCYSTDRATARQLIILIDSADFFVVQMERSPHIRGYLPRARSRHYMLSRDQDNQEAD